jgi:FKBP-type peptidyl-prolyl cis-trans isomerase 2
MRHTERSGRCALVRYRGGVVGEDAFEDRSDGEPERIYIGTGSVPPGVDETLYDMEVGEQRTVRIPPEKAYGFHDSQGVRVYPRAFIKNGERLERGTVFAWTNPGTGQEIPVKVIEATDDYVTIDFNHPLAGKELEYWFELVDIV